jgi:hypothetical protein
MARIITLILIWAVWSDTSLGSPAGGVNHYLTMRRALADIESGNNPCSKNKHSTASGKYQFVQSWDPWFKRKSGTTWSSLTNSAKCRNNSNKQDSLFDIYYRDIVTPWIKSVKARYPQVTRKLSDAELLALIHRQGEAGGEKYLKSGIDPWAGKYGNKHVATHLRAMRRQMGFYNYLDSMRG